MCSLQGRHLYSACFSLHPTHPITSRKAINEFALSFSVCLTPPVFVSLTLRALFSSCVSEILITCSSIFETRSLGLRRITSVRVQAIIKLNYRFSSSFKMLFYVCGRFVSCHVNYTESLTVTDYK